jgi:hypothetical protein
MEFDRIEKNKNEENILLLNQSAEKEDDDAIYRRKMK